MDFESQLKRQARLGIVKIEAGNFNNALQAIVEGVAVDIQTTRRLGRIGVLGKKGLEGWTSSVLCV